MDSNLQDSPSSIPNFRVACESVFNPTSRFDLQPCIYRSGNLLGVTENQANFFAETLKINCIIDLRSEEEIKQYNAPHSLLQTNIPYHNFPLSDYNRRLRSMPHPTYLDYYEYYMEIVNNNSKSISELLSFMFKSPDKRWLICCHAGKDRTGIIIMLLMEILLINRDIILADYCLSGKSITDDAHHFENNWKKRNMTKEQYLSRIQPDSRSLRLLIEELITAYGSILDYILHLRINPASIEHFRKTFANTMQQ